MTASDKRARQVVEAIAAVTEAIVETIAESNGVGVPGGLIYMALMSYGISLNTFESLMAGLTHAGLVVRSGHRYGITDKGLAWHKSVKQVKVNALQ
jgi:predicted transcriptional regulator